MENLNLNDIEQIMTFYLIFNFVIFVCLIYIIISLILRILSKNKKQTENNKNNNKKNKSINKRKKKDIIDLFWTEEKGNKGRTIFKRSFLAVLIIFTIYYIFNTIHFISANIDIVKKVLKIE